MYLSKVIAISLGCCDFSLCCILLGDNLKNKKKNNAVFEKQSFVYEFDSLYYRIINYDDRSVIRQIKYFKKKPKWISRGDQGKNINFSKIQTTTVAKQQPYFLNISETFRTIQSYGKCSMHVWIRIYLFKNDKHFLPRTSFTFFMIHPV